MKENLVSFCILGVFENSLRYVYGLKCLCLLVNLILGALSSKFHSTSSISESSQKQEELEKWKLETKIVETEKLKGENKIKRHIKLLWKVVVSSNNNLLFEKTLKNYLNTIMWN